LRRLCSRRRTLSALFAGAAVTAVAACGGSAPTSSHGSARRSSGPASVSASASSTTTPHKPSPPPFPRLLPAGASLQPTNFVPAMSWRGQTAVYVARRPDISLLSFDQRLVTLHLHSGTVDAGSTGWRYGPEIGGSERRRLVAAFNGAFRLSTNSGGFYSNGRTAAPLSAGLGSIVTYSDGKTDIGAWHQGVPTAGQHVVSVRQNLRLLIAGGHAADTVGCLLCWGATLGGTATPARSALGITADGHLIWAGGENLTVTSLAGALLAARVVRAVELDINPEWVAGYLYGHRGGRGPVAPVQVVAGQPGVAGQFLAPYSRDFFSAVVR
jgi:hypothetical protein